MSNPLTLNTTVVLKSGEQYAGIILSFDETPAYHLILLPGEKNNIQWAAARGWAADQGGELPSRREQSLLFANLKDQFTPDFYWSSDQDEDFSSLAGCQNFGDGYQDDAGVRGRLHARAVRRVYIG